MKTRLVTLLNETGASAMTKAIRGTKAVLAPFLEWWCAVVLVSLPFGASAGLVVTNFYSFTGTNDGENPYAGLVQGRDGNFYGTTYEGNTNGHGGVFKITTNGVFTSLFAFTGGNDGGAPYGTLVQASNGILYGTTETGGTNLDGSVFKITTNGLLTSLYSFSGGNDGANPYAGLALGSDGNLYGTPSYGAKYLQGNVFRISTNGVLTNLYSFTGGNDGAAPYAGLVRGRDGLFYGTTLDGGTNGIGTVFKITTNGTFTSLYSFTGGSDGRNPYGGLVQGSDGNFYGTTYGGGANNYGTVFRITTNGTLTTLHAFGNTPDGADSRAGLAQGADGHLYGTTSIGGTNGSGTVFRVSTNGTPNGLYSFAGGNDGASPYAGLVQGSDGNFYGTTEAGGSNGYGTVFRMTVVPAPPGIGLVQNGGFETGDFTDWSLSGNTSYTLVDDSSQSGITPHSGVFEAVSGAVGSLGYLSQTLSTAAGAKYVLSIWLNSPDGAIPNQFLISWNGTILFNQTDLPATGWTNLQFVVKATGTSTVLQFGFRDDLGWLALDDVSVVQELNIVGMSLSGTNLVLNGSNGLSGQTCFVLMNSNVARPLSQWTAVASNVLNANGNFTITATNAVDPHASSRFYILKAQ